MGNPLFNEQMNRGFMNQFGAFKQNPLQFLTQHRVNIPQQFANDPHGAIQHMLNSGQMSQQQLNQLMQLAQKMGIKL